MQGGRRRGEDRMIVVGGREVFDVLRNGGTEVLGAHMSSSDWSDTHRRDHNGIGASELSDFAICIKSGSQDRCSPLIRTSCLALHCEASSSLSMAVR
jgi:hypothetical protein